MKKITEAPTPNWKGNLDRGHGLISVESSAFTEQKFSFSKRVNSFGHETNPEQLKAAVDPSIAWTLDPLEPFIQSTYPDISQ